MLLQAKVDAAPALAIPAPKTGDDGIELTYAGEPVTKVTWTRKELGFGSDADDSETESEPEPARVGAFE